ncbi:MAG: hypothetical protein ACRCWG_01800 [Sarcina sp.]
MVSTLKALEGTFVTFILAPTVVVAGEIVTVKPDLVLIKIGGFNFNIQIENILAFF